MNAPKMSLKPEPLTVYLVGGPYAGGRLAVSFSNSKGTTLPFTASGQSGQYINGLWKPA